MIDPGKVPSFTLNDGDKIPCLGMGTFGSDRVSAEEVAGAVAGGLRCGYRLFDCAACYGNEAEIGREFKKAFDEGVVERKDLFIMSKVWNDMHRRVAESTKKTIADLQCDYLDMLFIHWPFPNYHAPHCDVDSRNPDSKPFSVEEFVDTYRQIEALVDEGLVRHIGISNLTIPKLDAVLGKLRIKPAACESEMHPCFQNEELKQYLDKAGILNVGYMPLEVGSAARRAAHSLLRSQLRGESGGDPERKAHGRGNGFHRQTGVRQPSGQGPCVPVARREGLARSLG